MVVAVRWLCCVAVVVVVVASLCVVLASAVVAVVPLSVVFASSVVAGAVLSLLLVPSTRSRDRERRPVIRCKDRSRSSAINPKHPFEESGLAALKEGRARSGRVIFELQLSMG